MNKYLKNVCVVFLIVVAASCGSGDSDPILTPPIPQLTTTEVTNITNTSALSGGNITTTGASPITARGVVWDVNANPTIDLATQTSNGDGIGNFTATLNGLSSGTDYFIRAYATNLQGTYYGNEIQLTTTQPTLALGQHYKGGIIAYFLKAGDPGYSATIKHGLIVNPTDNWYAEWGCFTVIGNTSAAFGQGQANTTNIIGGPACAFEVAAKLVDLSTYGSYTDWYLPSKEELSRIWHNWDVGLLDADLFVNSNYWTSTESDNQKAYIIVFDTGLAEPFYKYNSENICAVRAF